MLARLPGLAGWILVAGLAAPALAQQLPPVGKATGAYPASQLDGTASNGYYAMYPGAINYGLSGTFPTLGGYGYPGFGPGAQFGAHYAAPSLTSPLRATSKPVVPKNVTPKPAKAATKVRPLPRKGL